MPNLVYKATYSVYNRAPADKLFKEYFGDLSIKDALTKDVMIVAYSYNEQEPRFYSKFFAETNPLIYDVSMELAVGASCSTPGYFYPKRYINGNKTEELLVDGSIIT